jgi:NhaP-type Na+/H+ or K+/H+ antiporter
MLIKKGVKNGKSRHKMLIRIILILGSIGGVVASVVALVINLNEYSIDWGDLNDVSAYVFMIFCIIFFTLNTYSLIGGRIYTSLYFKRKKIEEEIKIQEAENKLKELQNKR